MASRCVHCDLSEVTLGAACRYSANGHGTLDLPAGRTCGDCIFFKRTCEWLISCTPERTSCDWYPPRFVQKQG
jgi:hypothetical protein